MPMPVAALVVPGLSPYRPLWTSAGVIAGELMLLVIASFPLRRVIGAKAWRRLHWATYAMFALAAIHGIASGTDTSRPWVMAFYAAHDRRRRRRHGLARPRAPAAPCPATTAPSSTSPITEPEGALP